MALPVLGDPAALSVVSVPPGARKRIATQDVRFVLPPSDHVTFAEVAPVIENAGVSAEVAVEFFTFRVEL